MVRLSNRTPSSDSNRDISFEACPGLVRNRSAARAKLPVSITAMNILAHSSRSMSNSTDKQFTVQGGRDGWIDVRFQAAERLNCAGRRTWPFKFGAQSCWAASGESGADSRQSGCEPPLWQAAIPDAALALQAKSCHVHVWTHCSRSAACGNAAASFAMVFVVSGSAGKKALIVTSDSLTSTAGPNSQRIPVDRCRFQRDTGRYEPA